MATRGWPGNLSVAVTYRPHGQRQAEHRHGGDHRQADLCEPHPSRLLEPRRPRVGTDRRPSAGRSRRRTTCPRTSSAWPMGRLRRWRGGRSTSAPCTAWGAMRRPSRAAATTITGASMSASTRSRCGWSIRSRDRRAVAVDRPAGVQIFTANAWKDLAGKDGAVYQARSGIAFETQIYPNAPNTPAFNPVPLRPGDTYRHRMVIQFEALDDQRLSRCWNHFRPEGFAVGLQQAASGVIQRCSGWHHCSLNKETKNEAHSDRELERHPEGRSRSARSRRAAPLPACPIRSRAASSMKKASRALTPRS